MTTIFDMVPELPTDSANYEVLAAGARKAAAVEGMTCEIGLRRGGGTKVIIDALVETKQNLSKTHIAIDPLGNIDYQPTDQITRKFDYTNEMRDECLVNLYLYCLIHKVNFLFFNLEDSEFFDRFADGVPIYNESKRIEKAYSFVHFDGPHAVKALMVEIAFFHDRTKPGAVFVFDDVGQYDHVAVDRRLKELGWHLYEFSPRKWAYCKT